VNFEYLRQLPAGPLLVDGFQLIHGSPLDEDEYLISATDVRNVFDYLETNISFFGHTHLQCGYARADGYFQIMRQLDPFQAEIRHRLDRDGIYLINTGSVGQPRDGDPRAAFAFFDTAKLEVVHRRVPYDYEETRRKIEAAGLPDVLGSRLAIGR
jgi:diadenosine tetraphosphatase ApaH/serine/threonine PP2A family protein phosphatase